MSKSKTKKKGRVMWGFIYVVVFLAAFLASAVMKMTAGPVSREVYSKMG